jgi:HD-like signal output (HDOD) protein
MIARFLGNRTGFGREEEGFIAGIIHDIGKVVLDQYFHDNLTQVVAQVEARKISFYQAEVEILGLSHADIGSYLAETWSLPEKLVEVISKHHQPDTALQYKPLVALISLSDLVARQYRVGSGGDALIPVIRPGVWDEVGLKPENIAAWDAEIKAEIEKGKELLEVMLN